MLAIRIVLKLYQNPMSQGSTKQQDKPSISLLTAVCMVTANMIGTGVFTSLGFQVIDIKSGFSILLLWLIGGVFALCGALSYGELGAVMPRSGGEYHYLSKIYHPAIGFLSGWVSVTVGFAAPIAAAAMALGAYFSSVIPNIEPLVPALFVVIGVSLIHMNNLRLGSSFQVIFTILKVIFIMVFIICGLFLPNPQTISFVPSIESLSQIISSPFAVSLVYVTYSYSGWNAAIYLASEVKKPRINIPRALLIGTALVTAIYLMLNFVFLYSTPMDKLAGELDVGYVAANQIFGFVGAKIMGLLISFGLISSISSMILAGPRVTQVIGEDIPLFRILGKKNIHGIPYYSILFQLVIVILFLITSSFEAVINYLGFTLTISSFLTVLGLFIHRIKNPNVFRPYKTWGYPLTPIIFIAISLWILIFLLINKPIESLWGLLTIGMGIPVYFLGSKKQLA